jgi:hypothetical protein
MQRADCPKGGVTMTWVSFAPAVFPLNDMDATPSADTNDWGCESALPFLQTDLRFAQLADAAG